MIILLILEIPLIIITICLGIALIHESDELGIIVSYFGFILSLILIMGYILT